MEPADLCTYTVLGSDPLRASYPPVPRAVDQLPVCFALVRLLSQERVTGTNSLMLLGGLRRLDPPQAKLPGPSGTSPICLGLLELGRAMTSALRPAYEVRYGRLVYEQAR